LVRSFLLPPLKRRGRRRKQTNHAQRERIALFRIK
jgi:hypothetical protein